MTKKISINIPYGQSHLTVNLPANSLLGVLDKKQIAPIDNKKVIAEFITDHKSKLKNLLLNKKRALLVVPDNTRHAHLDNILPALLAEIDNGNCKIEIIVGTGLHQKHSKKQLIAMFGQEIVDKYKVFCHDYRQDNINFGVTDNNIPIILDKRLLGHDFIMTIGTIEPHLYAGFSGGAKTIAIGLAGEEIINGTHNPKFLDHPRVKLGSIESNPFQETLWKIIEPIKVDCALNIVNDTAGNIVKMVIGDLKSTYTKGIKYAEEHFFLTVKQPADIVICGIGYPKDINLYQASRAINYVLDTDAPIVKKGGVIIVVAKLSDGIGEGLGEIRFYDQMKKMKSADELLAQIRGNGCVGGEHRGYMVARHMNDYNIIFLTENKKIFEGFPFRQFSDSDSALEYARNIVGQDAKIYALPKTLSIVTKVEN